MTKTHVDHILHIVPGTLHATRDEQPGVGHEKAKSIDFSPSERDLDTSWSSHICSITFQGQFADLENDLYYNRYRYYDALTGQYASADPIGLKGGFRPWGYAASAVEEVDPLGLLPPQFVPYGSTDLSRAVIQQRMQDGNFQARGTNYAAAKFKCKDGTERIAVARNEGSGGLHSEYMLGNQLQPGETMTDLYTERIPCSTCGQMLGGAFPGTSVTYSFSGSSSVMNDGLQGALNGLR